MNESEASGDFESLLEQLSHDTSPSQELLERFFNEFLNQNFLVPEREQPVDFPNRAEYPTAFSNLLGVRGEAETYIPIFTSEYEMASWHQNPPLATLEMTGQIICQRAPEHWWLSLNPGSEAGKEFSPWEITRLAEGTPEYLQEIILEILSGESKPVHFRALTQPESEKINEEICSKLEGYTWIKAFYSGVQISEESETFTFGILIDTGVSKSKKETFELMIQQAFIGDSQFEIIYGESLEDSPTLALFKVANPLYSQNQQQNALSWWNFLKKSNPFGQKT